MVCKRILLSGKVQGVGFRYHTHQTATKLNLKGFVLNLSDGRVEIVVCGDSHNVEALITWARKGPPTSKVEFVEITEVTDQLPEKEFHIRRD